MRIVMLGMVLCGLQACSTTVAPHSTASVTINGKGISLTQGRAWQTGHIGGMPTIDLVFAEKPLNALDWWGNSADFTAGKLGVVLRLKPALKMPDQSGQPTLHYQFDEDYQVEVYAADFGGWQESSLEKNAIAVTDLSVSKGVATGKLEWKGNITNPYDDKQTLTAWSADFSLPLDPIGEVPKK